MSIGEMAIWLTKNASMNSMNSKYSAQLPRFETCFLGHPHGSSPLRMRSGVRASCGASLQFQPEVELVGWQHWIDGNWIGCG